MTLSNDKLGKAPKESIGLAFPCEIDVKLFIANTQETQSLLKVFVIEHLDEKQLISWQSRPSRGGKYLAVTARVSALSREHIDGLYQALCDHEAVIMAI